jgi:predicted AlkP superfamily phosphohydrolase/phosphomutase
LIRLTRPGLASGSDRQTRTVWEVASGAGLRTVVVNWWATWPAPADSGVIVTDRAPLRLERGGALDAEIAPVEAYELLRTRWEQLRRETTAHVGRLSAPSDVEAVIHRAAELDALQAAITREVTPPNVDLVCTYFPGLDLVQHALLKTSEGSAVAASAVSSRLAALEDYYVFLDGLLAGVLQPSGSELVTIVTSPGRVASNTSGLALLRGAVANSRVREAAATAVDVTPTILYALGVPISQELKGRPIIELFSADFARRYPVRSVSTYGKPAARPSPRSGRPLDQEMIDRLRSLGYVR